MDEMKTLMFSFGRLSGVIWYSSEVHGWFICPDLIVRAILLLTAGVLHPNWESAYVAGSLLSPSASNLGTTCMSEILASERAHGCCQCCLPH